MPQTGISGGLFDHFRGHHQKRVAFLVLPSCRLNLVQPPPEKSQTLVHTSYRYVKRVEAFTEM